MNKFFMFGLCLFSAAYTYAQTNVAIPGKADYNFKLDQRILAPSEEISENGLLVVKQNNEKSTEKEVNIPVFLRKKMMNEKELRAMAQSSQTETLDSIVSRYYTSDALMSKQQFEYYKGTNYPKERINSLWDLRTESWTPAEIYNYTWDEDGYCLTQEVFNPVDNLGLRYVFTYNDQKLGISQTVYRFNPAVSTEWYMTEKGEYEYDSKGDMTRETMYQYDSGEWVPSVMNVAAWDEKHRMTLIEPYYWGGDEWFGNGEKHVYEWDSRDNQIFNGIYDWDNETNQWVYWRRWRMEHKNDDPKQCTKQYKEHYNRTYNNWSGCEEWWGDVYNNQHMDMQYDELGRGIYSQEATCFEAKANEEDLEYLRGAFTTNEYSEIEGGLTKRFQQSFACDTPLHPMDEDKLLDEATWHYDAAGNELYFFERHSNGVDVNDYEHREAEYGENGELLRSYRYAFNTNYATLLVFTYDENGNVLTQAGFNKKEQGNNDENWTYGNYFDYEFDAQHNILLDKKCYAWNGVEYVPNWGEGAAYDFDADMNNVYIWPGGNMSYKLLQTRSYFSNDGDWDWIEFNYFYSNTDTDVEEQLADNSIRVYPTCVEDCLYVSSESDVNVNLYNLQGSRVLSTSEKAINVSGLANGIYLVEVNGYKTKIVKK